MDLERLKAGVANSRPVTLHGEILTLRVLTEAELLKCRADALAFIRKQELDEESLLVDNVLRQLYLALSDGEGNRLAPTVVAFKERLTRGEREYLVAEYLELERECAPDLDAMGEEEFEGLVEEVKKNPDMLLSPSSTDLLRRLLRYLACRQPA
jgi:hypothetical protein